MAVPHFKLRPEGGDVRDWLTAYAKAGGPHHNAVCFGGANSALQDAFFWGILILLLLPVVLIGAVTYKIVQSSRRKSGAAHGNAG